MSKEPNKKKVNSLRSYFHPETQCHQERILARQIQKKIITYLKSNDVSKNELLALTGWSEKYAEEILRSSEWDINFAIRMAEHFHMTLSIEVTEPA